MTGAVCVCVCMCVRACDCVFVFARLRLCMCVRSWRYNNINIINNIPPWCVRARDCVFVCVRACRNLKNLKISDLDISIATFSVLNQVENSAYQTRGVLKTLY